MFFLDREERDEVGVTFSIRFLLVTTAEPDHIQKTESWLAADGKKKKGVVSKTQRRHREVTDTIKLHIWMNGSYGDSSSNSGLSHLTSLSLFSHIAFSVSQPGGALLI